MRITNQMVVNKFISNINKNASRMAKSAEQLSSGKVISRPSDNPAGTAKLLILNKSINEAEQYLKNADSAKSWLDAADVTFDRINSLMHRVREITVMGANGTWDETSRNTMAAELTELKEELLETANTRHEDKYIFATHFITEKPFGDDFGLIEPVSALGREIEIAPNIKIDLNNKGKEIFSNEDVFGFFDDLIANIAAGDTAFLTSAISDVDRIMDAFTQERVNIGAKTKRLENTQAKYQNEIINLTNLMSKVNDIDVAETMMRYTMEETVYQAALLSGNRMMNVSLLDFMR